MKNEEKIGLSARKQAVVKLYEMHMFDFYFVKSHYSAAQLIQRLLVMGDWQFQEEFNISDEKGAESIAKMIGETWTRTYDQLRLKAAVAHYAEWSEIHLRFSDSFRLEDISDEIIGKMLENIENRIQYIFGSNNFIILHRLSDNRIIKRMITENNK